MKCNYCGAELAAGQKFCRSCGKQVMSAHTFPTSDQMSGPGMAGGNTRICPSCGANVEAGRNFCKNCGNKMLGIGPGTTAGKAGGRGEAQNGASGKNKTGLILIIVGIIAVLTIVIAVAAIFIYKKKKDEDNNYPQYSQTSTIAQATEAVDEEEEDPEEEAQGGFEEMEEESPQEPENNGVTMNYVDNGYCDINANQTVNDFERVTSEDGTFYFSYPKHVFNQFSYSDNSYYYSYTENGKTICSMRVYKEPFSGDPLENGITIQNSLRSRYSKVSYSFPDNIREHGVGDDGIMQVVVSGWYDSSKDYCEYVLAGNDGQDTYYLEFYYPDSDPDNYVENWDYVVNCVYRMASFSGTKHQPYGNYNEFYNKEK